MKSLKQAYREWYVRTHYYPAKHPRSKYLWALVAVGALWTVAMEMDYQDQLLAEKIAQEGANAYRDALLSCMNGASGFYFPDTGKAFECRVKPL